MMRSVLTLFAAFFLFLAPARAQTQDAERFVTEGIAQAFLILNNAGLSAQEQAAQLETHLLGVTDLPRAALFTLGTAAGTASPAQRDAFVAAFRDYAAASWRDQFLQFRGGGMAVTGARLNAPGDVVVHGRLRDASGGVALPVDFRVRTDGPQPVIIDIGLAGIWLAVTQRDDFAAFLSRNRGDVDALTASLAARAQALH